MAYAHLTLTERIFIFTEHLKGTSFRAIGRMLSRHHTTISREIKRNGSVYANGYKVDSAQSSAELRRLMTRNKPKRNNKTLFEYVLKRLKDGDSPDVIAGRLRRTQALGKDVSISHEAIYQWIYEDSLEGGDIYKLLIKKHKRRKNQAKYGYKRGLQKNRRSIHDRPKSVNFRKNCQHWEGDLVEGKRGTGFFVTQTERKSKLIMANKISSKEASVVAATMIRQLGQHIHKIKSITLDNGREFYDHQKIEEALNIKVYFADPYCPHQRGTNEHANGILRRHFPKGTDFRNISNRQLQTVVDNINNRPRKSLQYRTPVEVYYDF